MQSSQIQYLRVLEEQKSKHCHVHVLLQLPYASLRINNSRYFDPTLYSRWKSLWSHGLSDYQVPRKQKSGAIAYVLKYVTKNATCKTIWKKLITPDTAISVKENKNRSNSTETNTSSAAPVKKYGVKLVTWSRNFSFEPFRVDSQSLSNENIQLALS